MKGKWFEIEVLGCGVIVCKKIIVERLSWNWCMDFGLTDSGFGDSWKLLEKG